MNQLSTPPQPLHEQIYLSLRASILEGDIGQGDRLVESRLAEEMRVSRTPIREAIRRLQQEGLLTRDPAAGITPAAVSASSAIQLYDCRIALETLAVEGACRHATAEQIAHLQHLQQQADALLEAAPPPDDVALAQRDLNYTFHRAIADASQNPWLVSLLDQLGNQVKLLRLQILQTPPEVAAIQAEHWDIIAAIARRDAPTATAKMRHHLEVSKTRIAQALQAAPLSPAAPHSATEQAAQCPRCCSQQLIRNGRRKGRQNYRCKVCGRQFLR